MSTLASININQTDSASVIYVNCTKRKIVDSNKFHYIPILKISEGMRNLIVSASLDICEVQTQDCDLINQLTRWGYQHFIVPLSIKEYKFLMKEVQESLDLISSAYAELFDSYSQIYNILKLDFNDGKKVNNQFLNTIIAHAVLPLALDENFKVVPSVEYTPEFSTLQTENITADNF